MILTRTIEQTGYCNTCEEETGDKYYVFCSAKCQRIWWLIMELRGKFDIDIELYKRWLEEKVPTIESMTTNDVIESRIAELIHIEFFAERESRLLHDQWDRINGRKGVPPHLKAERAKLITDPNIDVNFNGEPRKKEKKEKKERISLGLVDIDMSELNQQFKDKLKAKKASESKEDKPQKEKKEEGMSGLLASFLNPKPKTKLTEEELKAQAEALEREMFS